jgi:glycine cleavage system aminomethyltransferase T
MAELKIKALEHSPVFPFDPGVGKYHYAMQPYIQPWEYNGWWVENMSWKKTCYISAQLYPNPCSKLVGPDVIKFLSDCTTNSFARFKIGRCKHTVLTDERGLVKTHGLALRMGEEEVRTYSLSPWLDYEATKKKYNMAIEDCSLTDFNFQCGGPRVLEMLEAATGDDLHDIPFMGHRKSRINGKEVTILRMGMAGTLAYEVHGNIEDAQELYTTVYEVGKKLGVERLGWLAYCSNHTENGFPQEEFHFKGCSADDEGFQKFLSDLGFDPKLWPCGAVYLGSSGQDLKKRFRNPVELNWQNSISFDHDFPGKAIIEKLCHNPERKMVSLVWNLDDIMDVFQSLFCKEQEPYKFFNFPVEDFYLSSEGGGMLYQDDVFDKNDKLIGYSSGREYTLYSRQMFSLATIDVACAELGNEVRVLWGEPGHRQKMIRATVAPFPILDLTQNSKYDVEAIPHINRK